MVRLRRPTCQYCVATFRQSIGKEEFKLSHFIARKFSAGEIISFDVHFDAQFVAKS
jgi:hypothetical protein